MKCVISLMARLRCCSFHSGHQFAQASTSINRLGSRRGDFASR